MVAERTAVRFEREQDSRKYIPADAGERYSCIPGWDGEADTYFSYARRARQFVEGTKSGPRLEAQLTGRAESAVEGCKPGWLSTEHGVETLLRFLRTHCAKLAIPDMGSQSTRYRNEYTKVRRALARLQRTESPDDTEVLHLYFSPQEDQLWNWSERSSEGGVDEIPIHGPGGIGTPGRQTGAAAGMKQQHCVLKIMTKHHLCFLSRCLPGFFSKRVDSRQERWNKV